MPGVHQPGIKLIKNVFNTELQNPQLNDYRCQLMPYSHLWNMCVCVYLYICTYLGLYIPVCIESQNRLVGRDLTDHSVWTFLLWAGTPLTRSLVKATRLSFPHLPALTLTLIPVDFIPGIFQLISQVILPYDLYFKIIIIIIYFEDTALPRSPKTKFVL